MNALIVQTKEIGDVLFSTALCNTLKLNDPQGRVDYLVMDYCQGMAQGNPNIDTIVVFESAKRNDWLYVLRLMWRLRKQRYDVVVNAQGQIIGLLCCLLLGANTRIGFDRFGWNIPQTHSIPFRSSTDAQGNGWIVDDRFSLLAPLNLKTEDRAYRLWLTDEERSSGAAKLRAAGVDPDRPLVVFGVNARGAYKIWPGEFYAQVMTHLVAGHQAQILLYAGPGEESHTRSVADAVPAAHRGSVFADIPTADIRELMTLFAHADLFVGGDTGPRHMAQALDIPTFGIAAPTGDKLIWNPWKNPRFRAVDLQDALGLDDVAYADVRKGITRGVNDLEWFGKVTPEFVIRELETMLREEAVLVNGAAT